MPDFPKLPIVEPPKSFPSLPIITPDPPRKTMAQKYGGLYYLGIAGLVISLLLVAGFAYGLYTTRGLWVAIYVLSDPNRPEAERTLAAWSLAHDPSMNDRIRSDLALHKDLPTLARYVIAEGLTSEAIRTDPRAYALMVAKSEGWPDWLRLLMARPMAYGAGEGYRIAWEPLDQLREHTDPAIALWATYTRAVMGAGDAPAAKALAEAAKADTPTRGLAALLDAAARSDGDARIAKLDEATRWLRSHHPEAAALWKGWEERNGDLVIASP
ncbi:hypothetical protein TA3x_003649 [Tundrisphaera sp. TA3]|uniref:hypothetical protein n=1 Tax=Tundrisphaera sp. TA3 TaxID=3435775 RepID=UPI003EBB24E4